MDSPGVSGAQPDSRALRVAMWVAFGAYAFVYPFGIGLLVLGWMPPEAGWVGGVLLGAQGLTLTAWMARRYGMRRGLAAAAVIAMGAWALEAVGVTTGLPFGSYRYTPALGAWLGPVPLAIPFAWIASVVAAYFTAAWLLGHRASAVVTVALGALLATLLDAVLEPVATRVQDYWQWEAGGAAYYGVPAANFVTWFVASLLLGGVVRELTGPTVTPVARYGWLPVLLYGMSLLMFGVLDAARGFWVPAALAGGLLLLLLGRLR
ncbi:MAG TPA: carotenoid biosynthesis protein [Chloroflexia bacterium]|nr:carotenoid biosynthesis protein [Chloroflexia bacterium]